MCEKIYEMIGDVKKIMNDSSIDLVGNYYNGSSYIDDAISEQADSMIDIYTSALMDWAGDNIWAVENAVDELGYPGNFLGMIQQGQYCCYRDEMYDDIKDIYTLTALLMLRDEIENGLILTDDQMEDIIDDIGGEYDRFDQIADDLKEKIENVKDLENE